MAATSAKTKKANKKTTATTVAGKAGAPQPKHTRNGAPMTRHPRKTEAAAKGTQAKADKEKKPTTKQLLARANDEICALKTRNNRLDGEITNRGIKMEQQENLIIRLKEIISTMTREKQEIVQEANDASRGVAHAMTARGVVIGNILDNPELLAAVATAQATDNTVTLEVDPATKSIKVVARPIVFDEDTGSKERRLARGASPEEQRSRELCGN